MIFHHHSLFVRRGPFNYFHHYPLRHDSGLEEDALLANCCFVSLFLFAKELEHFYIEDFLNLYFINIEVTLLI